MVADDEAVDERAPEYSTWVSEDSDASPAESRATTDASIRNRVTLDEEHGRRASLCVVEEEQSSEERGSKARVRSFVEEEVVPSSNRNVAVASQQTRGSTSEEKGKDKAPESYSEDERESEGKERGSDEQQSDHESEMSVNEDEESEETDQARRRRKRKEKRRARSFLADKEALAKTDFFFCDYPFLLDPTTKARIMHIDAAMQMSYEVEVHLATRALSPLDGHTQYVTRFHQDAIAKLSFLGMLKEQSLPLFIPASVQRTAVPHLILEVRRQELIIDTLGQVRSQAHDCPC
jgi:hypothetical protein